MSGKIVWRNVKSPKGSIISADGSASTATAEPDGSVALIEAIPRPAGGKRPAASPSPSTPASARNRPHGADGNIWTHPVVVQRPALPPRPGSALLLRCLGRPLRPRSPGPHRTFSVEDCATSHDARILRPSSWPSLSFPPTGPTGPTSAGRTARHLPGNGLLLEDMAEAAGPQELVWTFEGAGTRLLRAGLVGGPVYIDGSTTGHGVPHRARRQGQGVVGGEDRPRPLLRDQRL